MEIDKMGKMARAFDGTTYYPGVVGLNNIKANDYENVVLHVSLHFEIFIFYSTHKLTKHISN